MHSARRTAAVWSCERMTAALLVPHRLVCTGPLLRHDAGNLGWLEEQVSLTVAVSCGPQRHRLPHATRACAVGRQLQCGVRWRHCAPHLETDPRPQGARRSTGMPHMPSPGPDTLWPPDHTPARGHRAPPATRRAGHLTPAVSRRAVYGTRMPQSCHWRGRLHCFVRPGVHARPAPSPRLFPPALPHRGV